MSPLTASRLIRSALTCALVAVLSVGVVGAVTAWAVPAGAAGSTLFAYPNGAATPAGCPQESQGADGCSLTEALSGLEEGETVELAVSGTPYVGNFVVSTSGTSAAEPVTIEPAPGAGNAVLDGNKGRSTSCPTTTCDGPVLTVAGGVFAAFSGLTVQNADDTTGIGDGGGISNEGTLTVTSSTFSGDSVGGGEGGAISNAVEGSGTLTVTSSTFTDDSAGAGGAIDSADVGSGTLTVTGSTFTDDSAENGGAIDNSDDGGSGTLTVTGSTFSSDGATGGEEHGGAIDNSDSGTSGTLTVTSSTFIADAAPVGNGGAIDNGDDGGAGEVTVTGTTFSGDLASDGGAIDNGNGGGGTLTVTSSTLSGDSAAHGGAIDNADGGSGTVTLTGSTFSADSGTDGAAIDNGDGSQGSGTLMLSADILAGATAGSECDSSGGSIRDDNDNVDDDGSCGLVAANGSVSHSSAIDSYLGALGNYGGPTETVPLLSASTSATPLGPDPALASVPGTADVPGTNTSICSVPDERGAQRSVPCDMGAFELVSTLYAYPSGSGIALGCPQSSLQADQCSLSTALAQAEPGEVVELASSSQSYVGNFTLDTAGTSVAAPVTITSAPGRADATLDGNDGSATGCPTGACDGPILSVDAGVHAEISGVVFQHADNTTVGLGGGIHNLGSLGVTDSTFTDDTAGSGGAINNGQINDDNEIVSGTLAVTGTTFSHDAAEDQGGAIDNGEDQGSSGTAVISDSSFIDDDVLFDDGGAIDNGDFGATGTLTVTSSTFFGDSAPDDGGAIDSGDNGGSATLTVTSSTFDDSSADIGGAAIANAGNGGNGGVALAADILAKDSAGDECSTLGNEPIADDGFNIDNDGTCNLNPAVGSVSASDLINGELGAIGNFGGQTETIPLLGNAASDPAIARVPPSAVVPGSGEPICSLPDERGFARGELCDVGAFELLGSTTTITGETRSPVVGQPITLSISVEGPLADDVAPLSGTVNVSDGTHDCVADLSGSGASATGSCSLSETSAGIHHFTANYGGSSSYMSSTTPVATAIVVGPSPSSTSLRLSTSRLTFGDEQAETISVAVAPHFSGAPSGTVTVKESSTTLCVIKLVGAKGTCKLAQTKLAPGSYKLTASYGGSSAFRASTSADEGLTVVKAA